MQPQDCEPRGGISFKGTAGLVVAVGVIVILLVALPAYRLFFLISVAIGVVVAGILYLWHKLKPVKPEDVDKRPLKLD
ncbi:MAG: hypothetical protein DMG70_20795 [Acidobacteria bacterium]|nr:MAG: hypothetical protein DMG70_20795 [Acidobacteriota bacterium]PYY04424.1 MAG: hypothetical protein DMG69_30525 [Acidobacteriota bacterium]